MGSTPPAAVGGRISNGERHNLGVVASSPTRASSFKQRRAGGLVE